MTDQLHEGLLCKDMSWQEWDAVLDIGRPVTLNGQCWLETYSNTEEIVGVLISGMISLLPISEDIEEKQEITLQGAPAVIDLVGSHLLDSGHWLAEQSSIYFYTHSTLSRAFSISPTFAFNFVRLLQAQNNTVLSAIGNSDRKGLRRLATSLLTRLDRLNGESQRLNVTQSQLATETGLSRQWVNHLLKHLECQNIATRGRGYIFLRAPARLARCE